MRIRLIDRNGLYVPQYLKSGYYGKKWRGFGDINLKFSSKEKGLEFIRLIEQHSCGGTTKSCEKVIYETFNQDCEEKNKLASKNKKYEETFSRL